VHTDAKRLQQILKNLLSNAFKFTEQGKVSLQVAPANQGWSPDNETLAHAKSVLAFSVSDTGIGVAADKQQIIFEAFQQADGSTSRKYGGTGLGLAITRENARLLGGEIRLVSAPGAGSTFTLYLPQTFIPAKPARRPAATPAAQGALIISSDVGLAPSEPELSALPVSQPGDDTENILPGDRVLMIVENDVGSARLLLDKAHESGWKGLIATRGGDALAMARQRRPNAISLDMNVSGIDGWRVLARLKDDPATRHIPVHLITTDEERERGLRMGAIGALTKPLKSTEALQEAFSRIKTFIEPRTRNLLVVNHDETTRNKIMELLAEGAVQINAVGSVKEAVAALEDTHFEAAVLELDLPDMNGFELIEHIKKDARLRELPLIVYVTRELSRTDAARLKRLGQTLNLREVDSTESLLDHVLLFLHCEVTKLPEFKSQVLQPLHETDTALAARTVLIVDDNIRNIFALTSLLERYQMQILSAENGKTALERLHSNPDIDVVLMDIMMPEMDGYDTMRAIRKLAKFRTLPIIALTSRAMNGDREKCIDAGASDYIAKPVNSVELLSRLRRWLYR